MTTTVLVPEDAGLAALAPLENVRALRYEPGQPLPADAADATVLVPNFLSVEAVTDLLAELPRIEYVQLLSAGAEVWIGQLPERVQLSTCRGAHGGSTAEWVLAALLAVYRELEPFADDRRAGRWAKHTTETLQDKRVLVLGAGDLGEHLARRLRPFDVEVTLVGRRARAGVRGMDEVPELLGQHDVTVLMVPLTTETRGLVDAAFLARMPDRSILVNAARGPVVDTDALLAELTAGRLRAALDVTEPEPLPAGHPLWSAPNLLLTPHVAGSVLGFEQRAWRVAAAEIARFVAGEPLHNLVHGEY
jgi:phosphoglycerate dehydrogenase-like enzyme